MHERERRRVGRGMAGGGAQSESKSKSEIESEIESGIDVDREGRKDGGREKGTCSEASLDIWEASQLRTGCYSFFFRWFNLLQYMKI